MKNFEMMDREYALRHMMELFDFSFSGKDVKVNLELLASSTFAVANREFIMIRVGEEHSQEVTAKAFNLHELGHILFTETIPDLSDKERRAHNILEDQRLEWIMSHTWPAMRKYFVYLAMNMIKPRDPILLWGRRFMLPFKVTRPGNPRKAEIIDEYMVSENVTQREALVKEFALINTSLSPEAYGTPNIGGSIPNATQGEQAKEASESFGKMRSEQPVTEPTLEEKKLPELSEELNEIRTSKEEADKEVSEAQGKLKRTRTPHTSDAAKQILEQKKKISEGLRNKIDDLKDEMQEAENEIQDNQIEQEGSGGGAGTESPTGIEVVDEARNSTTEKDLSEARTDAIKSVNEALRDIREGKIIRSQNVGIEGMRSNAEQYPLTTNLEQVTPGMISQLSEIMQKAQLELAGDYLTEQTYGRLNVRALMGPTTSPKVFKRFIPSREDEAQMSLILYVDISSSMTDTDKDRLAPATALALSEAAKDNGSEVYIAAFNSETYIMAMPHEKGIRNYAYKGGTTIGPAIDLGITMSEEAKYRKVQIIVTDGDIYDVDTLSRMRALTRLNYVIALSSGNDRLLRDRIEPYMPIYFMKGFEELPKILTQIIEKLMEDALEEAGVGVGA